MTWRLAVLAVAAANSCEDGEVSLVQVPRKSLGEPEADMWMKTNTARCSGGFEVMASDSCTSVAQECPGLVHLCCEQEGQTCGGQKSSLNAGDFCHASFDQSTSCDLKEHQDLTLGNQPFDWWPKVGLLQKQATQKMVTATCDGQPFTVVSGDICYDYMSACSDALYFCCDQAGQTCTASTSTLYVGDSCWASYGLSCSEGPEPPGPSPTMEPGSMHVGDWIKTWSTKQLTPEPLMMVICFSGFVKLSDAMSECERTHGSMAAGPLWLSIGGGNCNTASGSNDAWSAEILNDFLDNLNTVDLSSYKGIMFDLEANSGGCKAAMAAGQAAQCGASSGVDYGTSPPASLFQKAFDAVKAKGLAVGVTWSYQMPYCFDNSAEIVEMTLQSDAVKIVSPQMYGGGSFNPSLYASQPWNGNSQVTYANYVNVKGEICPSYTLKDNQYDMNTNMASMAQMQGDMKAWASKMKLQSFMDSPGCLAYQNS